MKETRSTCPYCGVGCGVIIESQGDRITGVRGDPAHPANFGRLCTKGSTLHLTASAEVTKQVRLLHPMLRETRGDRPIRIAWDSALDLAADRFAGIVREHGPDAVGFYISGQLLTEDYYVFNKLAKGLVGTNNIDTNSRLCMSSAVAAYKQVLGADAPPSCYDDIQHAGCIFIAGSNTAWAHPVLYRRMEEAKAASPALKIVVVDPRRTETAGAADLHLAIEPGTDVMLFNGMLHVMLWEGWTNPAWVADHTNGFEELKRTVRECTPELVSQTCGISKDDVFAAAKLFATSRATLSLYCQGLNQSTSGTAKNAALINLHLATAQIGRPGAGPFSLTGQPNAMGGREVGGLANLMSAHRDMASATDRAEVAALWGVPSVPGKPGKSAVEMFQAAADGQIKALWIACTNPAQSMPDQSTVRRALERADFVVVQEAFSTTATCSYADLLLPATTWGEKDGTVTNSERRISRVRAAVAKPGGTLHDWEIAVEFARRLEQRMVTGHTLFPYTTPESIWNEHRESTRGRDLDITGMTYGKLEDTPLQWPMPEGAAQGKARLYEDGLFPTADRKANFANVPYKPVAEPRDARYPLALTTGRLRDQWHGMSRTGTLGRLFGHMPEPAVELHPQDMARRGLRAGDLVHVTSRRGSIIVPAVGSDALGLGQVFIAMHWGAEYLTGSSSRGDAVAGVNALTTGAYCPSSRQPELKHAAVKVLKADLPWSLHAVAWLPDDTALLVREELRRIARMFPFVSCVPFGHARTGLLLRAAAYEAPPEEIMARIERLLGLDSADALRYSDKRKGQRRAVLLAGSSANARLEAFLLAGDTSAQEWMKPLLESEMPAQAYGRALLAPGGKPPVTLAARGRTICACFNVTDAQIEACVASTEGDDADRLKALQSSLKCGTNCGSCLPELRRLARAVQPQLSI